MLVTASAEREAGCWVLAKFKLIDFKLYTFNVSGTS